MAQGIIVRIIDARGFGFLKPLDGSNDGKDIFFHASALQGIDFSELTLHDRVTFKMMDDPRGRGARAIAVERTSPLTKAAQAAAPTDHWPTEVAPVVDDDDDENSYDWGQSA
jgi:CspA family cold shock protein